eukprot:2256646-Amphidinium_carterae.1
MAPEERIGTASSNHGSFEKRHRVAFAARKGKITEKARKHEKEGRIRSRNQQRKGSTQCRISGHCATDCPSRASVRVLEEAAAPANPAQVVAAVLENEKWVMAVNTVKAITPVHR